MGRLIVYRGGVVDALEFGDGDGYGWGRGYGWVYGYGSGWSRAGWGFGNLDQDGNGLVYLTERRGG